jgi:CRP-like cAMP-binding protein
MNQQELADYLFVERSGLSTEFNNLKKEGVLVQDSDKYILINPNAS